MEQFINYQVLALALAAGASDSTITVTNPSVLPTVGTLRLLVESEVMILTARSGAVVSVTRGAEGTSAVAHGDSVPVIPIITAGGLEQLKIDADAYTKLTASFTQPAVNATVSVSVVSNLWLSVGQPVFVAGGGGIYLVSSIPDTSGDVVLTNTGSILNATPGATIASTSTMSACGTPGINPFTVTTASFVMPVHGEGQFVTAAVLSTAWMVVGETLWVANAGYMDVLSITDGTHVVLFNDGYTGNAASGTTIASGSGVTPGGIQGPAGAGGTNAYTATAANFTMPAASSTVSVQVGSTAWMAAGQNLYVATAGYMSVSSITDATHVVLTNTGTAGNAASSTTITSGAAVAAAGAAGPQSPLSNVTVAGVTLWYPDLSSLTTFTASALFKGTTTSGSHTAVQVGPNLPLPNQSHASGIPAPPSQGGMRVDYVIDIEGTTTAVGAFFKGSWGWSTSASGATVVAKGTQTQPVAVGTGTGGALPSGWSAALQVTSGQVQLVVTTDNADTYTCKAAIEWGYTL